MWRDFNNHNYSEFTAETGGIFLNQSTFGIAIGKKVDRSDMLHVCTSGFMNDDMCPHSGSYGDMSIPLQLRAQDNASAASCWLRPFLCPIHTARQTRQNNSAVFVV